MTLYDLLQKLEAAYPDRHDWQRVGEYMPAQEFKDGHVTIKFKLQWDEKNDD